MDKPSLVIQGMHGLGDNLHQRAAIRLLKQRFNIQLGSSWVSVYHDLLDGDFRVFRVPTALRTQIKNANREQALGRFSPAPQHHSLYQPGASAGLGLRFHYNGRMVQNGTVLEGLFESANIKLLYPQADYRLPVPDEWFADADRLIETWGNNKPILIYRPLVARPEWRGSEVRNANAKNYAELTAMIRDQFFVVSVADLEPGREWVLGPQLKADATFHHGELVFETLAAMFARAKLVLTSSGFPSILAPAVGTPCISVAGGYHPASWHADGAKFAPYLGIDTMKPCWCASSQCLLPCSREIDIGMAGANIAEFMHQIGFSTNVESRPISEMFDAPVPGSCAPPRQPRPAMMNPNIMYQNRRIPPRRLPPMGVKA